MSPSDEIFVRADELAAWQPCPALVREAALQASSGPLTAQAWLRGLSDEQLDEAYAQLVELRRDQTHMAPWGLFAALLATQEGMVVRAGDDLGQLLRRLLWLVQAESLYRQGLVVLPVKGLSLGEFSLEDLKGCVPRHAPSSVASGAPAVRVRVVPVPLDDAPSKRQD